MLRRAEAGLVGNLGDLISRIADAKERIARANQRIVHLQSVAVETSVEELQKIETELDDVQEQIRAAQDVVDRTEVRAPVRSIVVKLNFHTAGAVVAPGAVILELLPVQDELIIEARVKPNDVSHVSVGQQALARLPAFNQRITPMILAKVIYLSADALREQTPHRPRTTRRRAEIFMWSVSGWMKPICASAWTTSGRRPACPPMST